MKIRPLRIAAALVAVVSLTVAATPASSLPRFTENFDCNDSEFSQLYHALTPGQTATVAITSCEGLFVTMTSGSVLLNGVAPKDEDSDTSEIDFTIPGDLSRVTATAGTDLWSEVFEIHFGVAPVVANPAGSLLGSTTVTFGRNPSEFVIGDLDRIETWYNTFLDKAKKCRIWAGEHVYNTSTLVVTKAGKYTVRVVDTDPVGSNLSFDPSHFAHPFNNLYVAAYPDYVRPWQAKSKKVIGCNEDARDLIRGHANDTVSAFTTESGVVFNGQNPWLTLKLKPGTYELLWTTSDSNNAFDWSRGINMSGESFKSGNSTLTYEVWGPVGGLAG